MNVTHCPLCGAPTNWQDLVHQPWERNLDARGWDRTEWSAFGAGVIQQAIRAGATYEKRRPTRAASVASDVTVPAAQSAISGAIVGVIAGSGAALCGAGWHSLWWSAGAGALGVGLAWLVILREHRAALWEVEVITGRDINGDGVVGRPPVRGEPKPSVRVEVTTRDERGRVRSMRWLDLGISDDQLTALARGLTDGKPLSESAWIGQGNPLSRASFGRARDELIRRSLARWLNPDSHSQGVELTPAGRAVMRRIVEQTRSRAHTHATGGGERVDPGVVGQGGGHNE